MNTKINILLLLSAFLSFGLIGCGDDKETEIIGSKVEKVNLELEKDSVEIMLDVNREVSINITKGSGEYNAFSLNTNIATTEIVGNKLTIKGVERGNTSIILGDKETQLKIITVTTLYDKIRLDKENYTVKYFFGKKALLFIPIAQGNGNYTAVSQDSTIVEATGTDEGIEVITQRKDGKAAIVVKDAFGREATVNIEAIHTFEPYNAKQVEALKTLDRATYKFNNNTGYSFSGNKIFKTENDTTTIGWEYKDGEDVMNFLKIQIPGDISAGEKKGAKIKYLSYDRMPLDGDLKICRVVMNDGKRVLLVFTYSDGVKAIPGYIMADIKTE